jgi:LPS-assembly lipoprotein
MSWFSPIFDRRPKAWMIFVAPLFLAACGFQVRSTANFPPEIAVIYIDAQDRYSAFYRELTTTIRQSELALTDDPTQADTVIRILQDETGRRVLTVSARNIPTEYEVYYVVQYSVWMAGEEVLAPKQIVRFRDYTYDETLVLGKALEEGVLREALSEDLVGLMVQHIAALN